MDKVEAESVVSNPESTVEQLSEAHQVLETVLSDAPQRATAPGSVVSPAITPTTPAPSVDRATGNVVALSSVADAGAAHDPTTKEGILDLLRDRLPNLPHGDQTHVHALIAHVEAFGEDVDDTIEHSLEEAMAAREAFEVRVKYLLKQLQGDGGYLQRVFHAILG